MVNKMFVVMVCGIIWWSRVILVSLFGNGLYWYKNIKLVFMVRGDGGRSWKLLLVRIWVRVLGGLVFGCWRMVLLEFLDEMVDYIVVLEM